MKILVVSFYDDNFGDMLIRICFETLLRSAALSLGVKPDDLTVERMNQKEIKPEKIISSDLVIFAGGAIFGYNYQNFLDGIEQIVDIADEKDIPVVFSSVGINNSAAGDNEPDRLCSLMSRKNIKAFSVREDPSLFEKYLEKSNLRAIKVCDPAVWSARVLSVEKKESRTVGINVVRGGLFKANGLPWKIGDEEEYLFALKTALDEKGIDYRFFTNGSVLDCNTLRHFAEAYGIAQEKLIYPDSSVQLVQTVASFGAVAAIRLHSAIVSYSLGIPSVNLNWNEKVPFFYRNTGYADRLVSPDENVAKEMAEKIVSVMEKDDCDADSEYLMSLFNFLFDTLASVFTLKKTQKPDFESVCSLVKEIGADENQFALDLKTKIRRGAHFYYKLFESDRKKGREIKELKGEIQRLEAELKSFGEKYEADISALNEALEKIGRENEYNRANAEKFRTQYNAEFERAGKYKAQLDRIRNKPLVKLYLKIKGIFIRKK